MALFFLGGALTLVVVGLLLLSLLRREGMTADGDTPNREIALYQDQLAEVARDEERGVITGDQALAAQQEIERRLLKAARRAEGPDSAVSRQGRMALVMLAAAVPLAAGGLYLHLGSPEQPGTPFADRETGSDDGMRGTAAGSHPEMRDRIAQLEDRLRDAPDDAEGQALLARSYASIGEYQKAIAAYGEANRLTEGRDRRLAGEYAEVMVLANNGQVSEPARRIFDLIQTDFPDDPQARYYLALATAQKGDTPKAITDLQALRADSPDGAPWLGAVDGLLTELGAAPPPSAPDPRFAGPSAEAMAAAAQMSDEDRATMIQGMVDSLASRLQENPEDVEGWRRLGRAYNVLGRTDDAANAYREVLSRDPNDAVAKAFLEGIEAAAP